MLCLRPYIRENAAPDGGNKYMRRVKLYFGVCRQEFLRLFCDWKLYVCLLLYVIVCRATAVSQYGYDYSMSAFGGIDLLSFYSNFSKLMVLLSAVPSAVSFCDDYSGRYINYQVLRSGKKSYILGKLTMCVLSSFAVSFTGLMLYAFYNLLRSGEIGGDTVNKGIMFYDIIHSKFPFAVVIIRNFLFAMVSSVYAVMGYALSSVIPNRFVAVTAPLFMNMFMEEIMEFFPKMFNLYRIQIGNKSFHTGSFGIVAFSVLVSLGYIIIFGLVFAYYTGRRVSNDIT
jgi:hypothetical protein